MKEGCIDLSACTVGFRSDGTTSVAPNPAGPPVRIDGLSVDAPRLQRAAPHGGEMHPDGDELLYVVSGRVTVVLEDREPPRTVNLAAGEALVVPKGVWHSVEIDEPSQLFHVTPGPGGEHRPLESPSQS